MTTNTEGDTSPLNSDPYLNNVRQHCSSIFKENIAGSYLTEPCTTDVMALSSCHQVDMAVVDHLSYRMSLIFKEYEGKTRWYWS